MSEARGNEPRPGAVAGATCHACSTTGAVVLPFRYAYKGRHHYGVRCTGCSLIVLHPMLSDGEIAAMYGEEYFTEHSDTCGAHGTAAYMEMAAEGAEGRARAARGLSERFLRGGAPGRALLEIGCGPGFLLAAFRDLGWTVTGIEISAFAARHARETLHLDVRQGSIDDADLPDGGFDAVFMGDVLEHLPRPVEALGRVRGLLRPRGVLIVAIPSTMNLLSARIGMELYARRGRFKTLRIPPYHLYEYTPRTIRRVLEQSGFTVAEVDQSTVPLRRMGLRGSAIENAGKVGLQVFAACTSRLFNRGGDRLLAVASR